jgi:hypothetical protein
MKEDLRRRRITGHGESALVRIETILLTGFAIFSLVAFSWGRGFMVESERTRLWGKGALLFTNVMGSGEIHERYLMANVTDARKFANLLDSIGLIHPPMIRTAEIAKLETRPKQAGFLDGISVAGQSCSATGWAIVPKTRRPVYCVVLSYNDPTKGEVAFRVSDEVYGRPDVAVALDTSAAVWSGWTCHFDRSALPPGDLVLRAWAFDANHAILYPLGSPKILH